MNQHYIPLHHKYRPQKFDDLVGQDVIVSTLKQAISSNRIAPAYLLCGPRGTGKTSSARILARSLNCLSSEKATIQPCGTCEICKSISTGNALDIIEIDAASNTGVENIRELIEKSRFAPVQSRWKVYVIDECHMLSTAAFNALLKTLEEPPLNTVFILATTDPQRVIPTIVSRCQRFDFRQISLQVLTKHLQLIADKEQINIESEAINLIAQRSQGGLRDAESMLDQLSLLPEPITINAVWDLLGAVPEQDLLSLAGALADQDPILLIQKCRELIDNGREPIAILQGITSILRDLVIINVIPQKPELCSISKNSLDKLLEISSKVSINILLKWQEHLKGLESQLRHSQQPRLWIEVMLLGILSKAKDNHLTVQNENKLISKAPQDTKEDIINSTEKDLSKVIQKQSGLNKVFEKKNFNIERTEEKITEETIEIWKKIIARVDLPSTKMLLSQQAELINLTERKAEVHVSANWISMIQSRKKILEKAINEAIGGDRELIIEVKNSNDLKITNPQENKKKIEPINETNYVEDQKPLSNQENMRTGKDFNQKDKKSLNSSDTQKFADFFNGEVLNLDLDN